MIITTEKRSKDWIAFLNEDRTVWETGKSEAEAVGNLVIKRHAECRIIVREWAKWKPTEIW